MRSETTVGAVAQVERADLWMRRERASRRPLLASALALLAVMALATVAHAPPAPRGLDAAETEFSAGRAFEVLSMISGAPRPAGSASNAAARAFLTRSLEQLGWQVQTQRGFACGQQGFCGYVENIVATLDGREQERPWVALAAHYDSVSASPGSGDDGLGVATVLEVARALTASERPRRTLCVLLTDGEEDGLLGAEAFVRSHPFARRIGSVLNVDARGNRGPSLMFEVSTPSAVVPAAARVLEHPNTSSIYYEVYRHLPNRTDFTLLGQLGKGASFANVAGLPAYHSAIDTPAQLDRGTVQHHGDQMLALAREFGNEIANTSQAAASERLVWFDLFGAWIARFPESWCGPLAALACALLLLAALRRGGGLRATLGGLGTLIAAIGGGVIASQVLAAIGALPSPWVAEPIAACVSIHAAALALGCTVCVTLARRMRLDAGATYAGAWLCLALLGLASALLAPGASYLLSLPALVAGVVAVVPALDRPAYWPLSVIGLSVLCAPLAVGLYDTLGCGPVLAAPTAILLVAIAPMLTPVAPKLARVAAIVCVVAGSLAFSRPAFSPESPQRVNVAHRQDDAGNAVAVIDGAWGSLPGSELPARMLAALGDPAQRTSVAIFPGAPPAPAARSQASDLPYPEVDVLDSRTQGRARTFSIRLRSPRAASALLLALPDDPSMTVRAEGLEMRHRIGFMERSIAFRAVPATGIVVELQTASPGPIPLRVFDVSSGVPSNTLAARILALRPAAAAAFQEGDITVLVKHATL